MMSLRTILPWRTALRARHKGLSSVDLTRCAFLRYHGGGWSVTRNAMGPATLLWMFSSSQETGRQALSISLPLHCVHPILPKCTNTFTPQAKLLQVGNYAEGLGYSTVPGELGCSVEFPGCSIVGPGLGYSTELPGELGCSSIGAELPGELGCSSIGAELPGEQDCPGRTEEEKICSSVLKKRRKKMNKHKYRKWRRRTRFIRRALKNA